jgi:aprataxin and PNK-like factor
LNSEIGGIKDECHHCPTFAFFNDAFSVFLLQNVPESSSSNIVKDPDVDIVKTNKQKDGILIEELGEVSKHKAATKPTTNEEGESCARVQSKSPPEKSQGCHPESSSAPSSPDALHTDTADPVLGCSEESKVRRTACMYGANCYR